MTGYMPVVRRIALIALVLIAGCGGGDEEEPLTAGQWAARADAACKRAMTAVVERGWADDLDELGSHARAAAADLRTATAEIRRLPVPPGEADDVESVIASLGDLEPELTDIARASEEVDLDALAPAAGVLHGRLFAVGSSARRAGLRWCLQHGEVNWVTGAVRAPLAAEQLARVNLRLGERMESIADRRGDDTKLRLMDAALRAAADGILDVEPPSWVAMDVDRYSDALRDYAAVAREMRARVDRDGRLPKPERAAISAAAHRAHRLCVRVMRRVGADPVSSPPSD